MRRRMSDNPLFAKFAKQKPREFRARVSAELAKLKRSGKPLEWAHQMAVQARATVNVNESIAQAHIKSLSESQIPAVRVQILQTLAWSIARTNHKEIILGDAGAVAREMDDTQFKHPVALEFSRLGMLCCPIGSSSVLVGRAVGLDHSFWPLRLIRRVRNSVESSLLPLSEIRVSTTSKTLSGNGQTS
jgi:hypothetical protein